jgi:methylated-DNA-protein-cysteine methyltransferase related protein
MTSPFYEAVYGLVRRIPSGRVMSYGQIAVLLGHPRAARAVGYAMRASGNVKDVPWQRVINAQGRVSTRAAEEGTLLQQRMLEEEGIRFDATGVCDLERYRWEPEQPEAFFFESDEDFPFR